MRRLRVLYVTDRWDGPYRYRCLQACEQLRRDGVVANVLHATDAKLLGEVPRYDVLVLFRLVWTDRIEAMLDLARRAGIAALFDIDDLAFDSSLDELAPFRRRYTAAEWNASYGRQIAGLRRTLTSCAAFIGSTAELAEHARRLGMRALVHPNVVPEYYLRAGSFVRGLRGRLRSEPTIGYFSGSDTHDEDFASIAPAIERVLGEHPRARLLVCGHLRVSGRYPRIERRLMRLPYMHWRDFAYAYAACHVTVAPLAVKNAFTDAKSALKFFEAGAFHTPTVASPVREMVSAIEHDATGWLAATAQDWADLTARALDDATSERVGRAARRAVEEHHSFLAVRGRLRNILEEYATKSSGPEPELAPLEPPDESGDRGFPRAAMRPVIAVRNLATIYAAARRRLGDAPDSETVDRVLDAVRASEATRLEAERWGAHVVADEDFSNWRRNEQVAPFGDLPGESRSLGTDPQLTSPELTIEAWKYSHVAIRIRVHARSRSARLQVYWALEGEREFRETASAVAVVEANGLDANYVLPFAARRGGAFSNAARVVRLRIDPMDTPGSFRIGAVVLFPECTGAATFTAVAAEGGERSVVLLSGTPEFARKELAVRLRDQSLEVSGLRSGSHGITAELVPARPARVVSVDIIVPIYNARPLVERCVRSILSYARGDFRLVLLDDASTDPELRRFLSQTAADEPRVQLLTNEQNLGFVRTANRGFRGSSGRDVLLLNSDTEVFEGFLERIVDCAYSHERIGLVSPLSNNATILSVPEFCRSNDLPGGITAAEVARMVKDSSRRRRPEIVTPHGFCMYVKARVLSEVGVFDEEHYGRGFGEENDLGERAKNAGWKVVAADDVYVWHAGKASFGDEGRALESEHAAVLERMHPGYHADVAEFVRRNPLADAQRIVERCITRRSSRLAPAPLFVLHENPFAEEPGGVEYSVRDLVHAMALPRAVLLYPEDEAIEVSEVIDGDLEGRLVYRFVVGRCPQRFCHTHAETAVVVEEVLDLFRIGWAHVHHLMFLPLDLPRIFGSRNIPYLVTVHDFYWACPSFNLLDVRTTAACCPGSCGDRARTSACLQALFRTLGEDVPDDPAAFVDEHRTLATEVLTGARAVVFPSKSAERLTSSILRLEPATLRVVPHGYDAPSEKPAAGSREGPLRVGIVGQLSYASKGAEAYLTAIERSDPGVIEWHLFGRTDLFDFDRRLAARAPHARIVRHGSYERGSIVRLLRDAGVDVGLLLPAWPETFSYTLSELQAAGIPVVAARVGALEDRLDRESWARLVGDACEAASTLERLAHDRALLSEMTNAVRPPEGTKAWANLYGKMHEECASLSPVKGVRATTVAEYERLNDVAAARAKKVARSSSVTEPSPSVAASGWYRYATRLNPYLPESLRHVARRLLTTNSSRDVLRFRLPGPRAKIGDGLSLERRYLTTTKLTAHGTDPYLLLEVNPINPREVDHVRFNLWCSTPRHAFAQLYFRHEGARTFDEEHSIVIPLDGKMNAWQEYTVRFDGTKPCRAWYEGGSVVELRFDPINLPGPIALGELVLGGRRLAS